MIRPFVVVSGLPGCGKTTVARAIAPLLGLPLIDKDEILERLFETRGVGDAASRRALSRESDRLLQAEAARSTGAVLASFWNVPGMPADSGTPIQWLNELSDVIVNVRCRCPVEVAAERFARRTRHPGHLDGSRSYDEVLASMLALPQSALLPIAEIIDVDTSSPVAPGPLAEDVRAAFDRRLTARRTSQPLLER